MALDLPLVPQDDLDLMLLEFNNTLTDFPADKTINQLFEAHASAQPDAICIVDGDSVLTYAEVSCHGGKVSSKAAKQYGLAYKLTCARQTNSVVLESNVVPVHRQNAVILHWTLRLMGAVGDQVDRRANQLAYHLVASGVSPGATVMLLMHSSPDAIVSMLAVLKAGCAYSALSPKHDELGMLVLDASPALVITHKGLHGLLPRTATPLKVFNFDAQADSEALAKRWVDNR